MANDAPPQYSEIDYRKEEPVESDPLNTKDETKVEQERAKVGKTFWQAVCNIKNHITIEPTQGLFVMPSVLGSLATQNLNLEKACRVNLNFTTEICDALHYRLDENYTDYKTEVQRLTTSMIAWKSVITTIIPCMLLLFLGSWSDRTGRRKVCMLMPIVGEACLCISNIINVYFFYELRLEFLILMEALCPALGGGWCTMFLGVYSYISDITTEENRTFRMGIVNFCLTVSLPVGLGLSGVLLKSFGYYGVYLVGLCIHLINFAYTFNVLKDPPRKLTQKLHDNRGFRHFITTFFNFRNVAETLAVVFKNGPNNRRLRICILLAVVCVLFGPMFGELSVLYLSTIYRFGWDEVKFSIFTTYSFVTHTIGTIFSITVFSKCLKWHDAVLGIISTISKIASSFIYCFAKNEYVFYLAPLVEILNGTSLLALRSMVSKLVAFDDLGKVNSIFGLTENLTPLFYVPLYTSVYMATIKVLPGAVFLMGAAMTVPAVCVFCWLFYEHRRNLGIEKRNETINEE